MSSQRYKKTIYQTRANLLTTSTKTRRQGVELLFLLVIVLGGLHVSTMIGIELSRYRKHIQAIPRLEAETQALAQELGDIRSVVAVQDSDKFKEHLPRRQRFAYVQERLEGQLP